MAKKPNSKSKVAPRSAIARAQVFFQQAHQDYQHGRLANAEERLAQVLQAQPGHFDALHLSGVIADQTGRPSLAAEMLQKAIAINPTVASIHFNLGNILRNLGQYQASAKSFSQAFTLKPDYYEAYFNCASVLVGLKAYDVALLCYEKAISANPREPKAYNNRGNLFLELGQYRSALEDYNQAIALDRDYADAHSNRGNALKALKDFEGAVASYDRALLLEPQHALTHWNKSIVLLLTGNYGEGWTHYEWGWQCGQRGKGDRGFPQPLWQGDDSVAGKTILLHAEQGYGDTIQFCRYAETIATLGAQVILEVQPALVTLLERLEGPALVLPAGSSLPPFDVHCPLLSAPKALKTEVRSIPAKARYLSSNPRKNAEWARRLGPKTRPRVGLAWSGNPTHLNDRNRSLALANLLRHLPVGYQYVSLQKDIRSEDLAALQARQEVDHFGHELRDFSDSAALCELMDLIVCVDTSIAHLGGALGKETWVLLPHVPDWRWLLDRSDSPWYPSVTLYRQTEPGNWQVLLETVGAKLVSMLARN